jgi:hypothetical protein
MGQRDDQRLVRVGLGVAILSFLLNPLIQLGQALGYKLSGGELLLLFILTGGGFIIGVLILLGGLGVFRPFRHLQSPITLRSLIKGRSTPPSNTVQTIGLGRSITPANVNLEMNNLRVRISELEMQLREWGNDEASRKLLKLAMNELPKLSVGFVKDFAGLLYAAHIKPRTNFTVEFKASDDGTRGTVGLTDINRSLDLSFGEASMYAGQFRKLIEQVQNDSINEAKRQQ